MKKASSLKRKNRNRIMVSESEDDDIVSSFSSEKSENNIQDNSSVNSTMMITSTPDKKNSSVVRGKSYFKNMLQEKKTIVISESESDDIVISDSGDELNISANRSISLQNGKRNISGIHADKKNHLFMTPRSKKPEITSDSEDEESDIESNVGKSLSFSTSQQRRSRNISTEIDENSNSDVINSSQVIEDSFEDSPSISTPKNIEKVHPRLVSSVGKTQSTLDNFVKKNSVIDLEKINKVEKVTQPQSDAIKCKRTEYNEQIQKIKNYEMEMLRTKNYLNTIKLTNLPDKGQLLKARFETNKSNFLSAQERLRNMIVVEEDLPLQQETNTKSLLTQNWNNLEAGIAVVQPKTFGKKGLQNHNIERALTVDCLEQLHGSLKNRPSEEQVAADPVGLKVPLMDHQKRALTWLQYRETQRPPGGILADDMGLGKTLTMISLVLNTKSKDQDEEDLENEKSDDKKFSKYKGGTLIVCPASLLNQWAGEIDAKLKRGYLSYDLYHGPKRETKPKRLAQHDIVITTYTIVMNELDKNGPIFRVRWKRLILDEAHQIRNFKSQTSIACCELVSKLRWALTGTPVHNKELDMYALLKFLKCSPFDDLAVWKRWVSDKNSGGGERLHTVISSLMLRRTKDELMEQGKLTNMPSRKWELVPVVLDEDEMGLYHKVLLFSQTLFAQFLHQRAERNQDIVTTRSSNGDPNGEYFKMRQKLLKLNKMKEVSQHEILVLLLRLRQICCHPFLITKMLQGDEDLGDEEPEEREELNLLEQLNKLQLDDDTSTPQELNIADKGVGFKEAAKGLLNPSHPVFARDRLSSKVLLLSLTAGGVGLNLIGANHLFLLDLHWNPQLENQAQDRIYRIGQKKNVNVYKFMATNTIEERIKIYRKINLK
ncbi:hypothetical protein HHI36_012802 [Cryptolaemus montrouzieri]|uniref:Transcription termination factor 2 n=1 Tax=Cryptolaemus montrouzieri TaxID=559131 RepID=A0ABD2NFS6_9CUCU